MKKDKKSVNEHTEEVGEDPLFYLKPKDTINVNGAISYKERLGAFGLIQIRKQIIDVFPQLREKRGQFGYTMIYNASTKELKKIMDDLEKKDLVPILLLLGRVKEK